MRWQLRWMDGGLGGLGIGQVHFCGEFAPVVTWAGDDACVVSGLLVRQ